MSDPFQPPLQFDAAARAAEDGEGLIVDLEGYEGPLHALLALARTQKVDLLKLSISQLADQYLAFVKRATRLQCCGRAHRRSPRTRAAASRAPRATRRRRASRRCPR